MWTDVTLKSGEVFSTYDSTTSMIAFQLERLKPGKLLKLDATHCVQVEGDSVMCVRQEFINAEAVVRLTQCGFDYEF